MQLLNSHLSKLCDSLRALNGSSQVYGVVIPGKEGQDVVYLDESMKPVAINDESEIYIYNKFSGDSFAQIPGRGKEIKYKITAQLEMICYSKIRIYDQVIKIMSGNPNVILNSSNVDAKQVFKSETKLDKFDPEKYLFSVKYGFAYYSEKCVTCVSR